MSKGQRGVGLNKPCPKCGSEVPHLYVSPVQEGLCGKCTDEILRKRAKKLPAPSKGIVQVVPGGGSTVIGFALGLLVGFVLCVALAAFAKGFWASVVSTIGG
jgi:hypothetical protein